MRNVAIRSEYVVTLVAAMGGSSGRRSLLLKLLKRKAGGWTLSVITQLATYRLKPRYARLGVWR